MRSMHLQLRKKEREREWTLKILKSQNSIYLRFYFLNEAGFIPSGVWHISNHRGRIFLAAPEGISSGSSGGPYWLDQTIRAEHEWQKEPCDTETNPDRKLRVSTGLLFMSTDTYFTFICSGCVFIVRSWQDPVLGPLVWKLGLYLTTQCDTRRMPWMSLLKSERTLILSTFT